MGNASDLVTSVLGEHRLVVFSKTSCPFCVSCKDALSNVGALYHALELDKRDDGRAIQDEISKRSGIRTVPQVFLDGKFIGDSSQVRGNLDKLTPQLKELGIITQK